MTVVMKNGVELLPDAQLVAAFDGHLDEECSLYSECGGLSSFVRAGKWVGEVEYESNYSTYCPKLRASGFMAMHKKPSLYAYRVTCW